MKFYSALNPLFGGATLENSFVALGYRCFPFLDGPVGGFRVYVNVGDSAFTYDRWIRSFREGHSFFTNGPLFREFRLGTAEIGDSLVIDPGVPTWVDGEISFASHYPVESVDTMANIARITEESPYYPRRLVDISTREIYPPHAICEAAGWASRDLGDVPVVVFTASGNTALYLAKTRNQSRIFAFSPYKHVACMLSLAWNITPFVLPFEKDLAVLQKKSEVILQKANLAKKVQLLLMVCGTKATEGATNFLRVKKMGEV